MLVYGVQPHACFPDRWVLKVPENLLELPLYFGMDSVNTRAW